MIRVKIVVSCDEDGKANEARAKHTVVYQVQTNMKYGEVMDSAVEFLKNPGFVTDPTFGDAWEDDEFEYLHDEDGE